MEQSKNTNAGFWLRLLAYLLDRIILGAIGYGLGFIFGFLYVSIAGDSNGINWASVAFSVLVGWIYFAGFESSKYQATFGKRIVGIRVVDIVGNRISFGVATLRHFGKLVSAIVLGIGFLMILWTKNKQGLHDKIAKTLVVKK